MSVLVHYTLKSADDHAAQTAAMQRLVADLRAEAVTGVTYSCFATEDPTKFIGILEFAEGADRETFLGSAAFATYRDTVSPTFANRPEASELTPIATTRD